MPYVVGVPRRRAAKRGERPALSGEGGAPGRPLSGNAGTQASYRHASASSGSARWLSTPIELAAKREGSSVSAVLRPSGLDGRASAEEASKPKRIRWSDAATRAAPEDDARCDPEQPPEHRGH